MYFLSKKGCFFLIGFSYSKENIEISCDLYLEKNAPERSNLRADIFRWY